MKKIIYLLGVAFVAIAMMPQAFAVPGYSRQTALACSSCHYQSFPALNELGRSFKAGGFTMMGTQKLVEGSEGLSLPETLNAGFVTKIRYQQANGAKVDGTNTVNDGQLQMFDELLLILGGRVSENIGVQVELNLPGKNTDPVVENFKMPFIYDVGGIKAGVIPFTTGGQGVSYGFELMNTGAVRGGRIMEARKTFSAQQYIGTDGKAEGVAAVASNSMFFFNVSKWSPRSAGDTNKGSPTANYIRLGVTPKLGIWDTAIGVQSWSGQATQPTAPLTAVETKAYAVDAQVQGDVAAMPVGIYLTYANASGSDQTAGTIKNAFNANPNAETAMTIAGQLGVVPGRATLLMAYRKGDNGKAANNGDNAIMFGGTYLLTQNVQFQLNHEKYSGSAYDVVTTNGDQLTTLMLFGGF
ncbi:MAG: hypothetical protein B7Y56_06080 [Gallionellales bacterium 35-53-114]|jgi:hypothetical protein|nr:MAG: hypothetical protein B7Y56_06080 [Gallionellales bacterium 35-53-114]OYZ63766.1 MAG: hypothetical protein B7Y04_07185 [Gallionellales bacterium 24-53-125]OZB09402.1 MAG: hypothetical protein B7X61_07030 [Gallionellales bacterium 39-52-133]HQS57943.1 hypothetical protein [Gallionellaceae bacterium]HQS76104.1 hypothetical protein [Gallionellaceae bacterium]